MWVMYLSRKHCRWRVVFVDPSDMVTVTRAFPMTDHRTAEQWLGEVTLQGWPT